MRAITELKDAHKKKKKVQIMRKKVEAAIKQ